MFRETLVKIAESIARAGYIELEGLRSPNVNYQELIQTLVLMEQDAAGEDKERQMAAIYAFLMVR